MSISFLYNTRTRQFFAAVSGGLCMLIVGNWIGWTSPFVAQLQKGNLPFNLTTSEISWVVSAIDFGTVFSPIPCGYLMDAYGRKVAFFLTAIIYQVSWILAIFAYDAKTLTMARFLGGLARGMSFTVCPMYLAEIAGTNIRGTISGVLTVSIFSGNLLEFLIGLYVPLSTLTLISAIVPLIFFVAVIVIPESPYYLLMKNESGKAYKSYTWLHHPNTATSNYEEIQSALEDLDTHVKNVNEMASRRRWISLISSKGTRHATFVVLTLNAMQRLSGINSMISYMSTTLPANDGPLGPEECMTIFSGLLLITITCMPLGDWIGRRQTLLISGGVCALLQAITATFYYFDDPSSKRDILHLFWIPYSTTLAFAVFYELGLGIIPHTLLGEMFPANVKSKAAATATISSALSTFLLNKVFPIVSETFGKQYMFIFFAASNAIATIFTYFFVIETKGKTFKEIQALLNR